MQTKKVYSVQSVPGPDLQGRTFSAMGTGFRSVQGPDFQHNRRRIPSTEGRIFDFDFDFDFEIEG